MYLAVYKGNREGRGWDVFKARAADWAIRLFTRGQYSHCELVVPLIDGKYQCYSASIRDGGVRCKVMELPLVKWDLIPVKLAQRDVHLFFEQTQGKPYDLLGALGVVLPLRQSGRAWFCSEWCAAALGLERPHKHSPNSLARLVLRGVGGFV